MQKNFDVYLSSGLIHLLTLGMLYSANKRAAGICPKFIYVHIQHFLKRVEVTQTEHKTSVAQKVVAELWDEALRDFLKKKKKAFMKIKCWYYCS